VANDPASNFKNVTSLQRARCRAAQSLDDVQLFTPALGRHRTGRQFGPRKSTIAKILTAARRNPNPSPGRCVLDGPPHPPVRKRFAKVIVHQLPNGSFQDPFAS